MELMGSSVQMVGGFVKSIGMPVHFWRFQSLGEAYSHYLILPKLKGKRGDKMRCGL